MTPALPLLLAFAAAAPSAASLADDVQAADAAMSRAVEARDAAAFAAFLDPDAIFAGARGLSGGRDVAVASWRRFFTDGGPTLAWSPERAIVASSGDLAVTTGRYTWTATADGNPARAEGEYVTVWVRTDDARWRVLFDAPLEPAARLGGAIERTPVRFAASKDHDVEATLGTWKRGSETGALLTVRHGKANVIDSAFPFRPAP